MACDCCEIDSCEKMSGRSNGVVVGVGENGGEMAVMVVEKQTGASMMEQLVPEITMHALSYLDYQSLCCLSMTNSIMRRVANDDNAWKALYRKDFTSEQDSLKPPNGWKAYYAATRAIVDVNSEFFRILREKSLPAMALFWLNTDYIKCVHASGSSFSGHDAVMESWQLVFSWEHVAGYNVFRDIRIRVQDNMAWVTMKAYADVDGHPDHLTNVYEFHEGRWYLVHHHISGVLVHAHGVVGPHHHHHLLG